MEIISLRIAPNNDAVPFLAKQQTPTLTAKHDVKNKKEIWDHSIIQHPSKGTSAYAMLSTLNHGHLLPGYLTPYAKGWQRVVGQSSIGWANLAPACVSFHCHSRNSTDIITYILKKQLFSAKRTGSVVSNLYEMPISRSRGFLSLGLFSSSPVTTSPSSTVRTSRK